VLASGWYILGDELAAFENEFAAWLGVPHVVGVASGTDAIELALRACDIGMGDAVFTVSHTAVATVAAIERSGARPVFVDVEPDRLTLCPASLADAIQRIKSARNWTPRAVIPVHLYGQPAAMPAILDIARREGLRVIEDCAQAHGAKLDGQYVGTFGDAAAFSFYPTKNLAAMGDGGAVACQDAALAERLRALRQYGWRERNISDEPGVNSRLDELQAAILRVRLTLLDQENNQRRALARRYIDGLHQTDLQLPSAAAGAEHVYHLLVVRHDQRDNLQQFLHARGIQTARHYPLAVHQQPAYRERLASAAALPVTESITQKILSLPLYPQLSTMAVDQVIAACQDWAMGRG
jgi:dTDP-4-amino-4,6-dideoxygalactose transaminase